MLSEPIIKKAFYASILFLLGCASSGKITLTENESVVILTNFKDAFTFKQKGFFTHEENERSDGWEFRSSAESLIRSSIPTSLEHQVDIIELNELGLKKQKSIKQWAKNSGYRYLIRIQDGNNCLDAYCNTMVLGVSIMEIAENRQLAAPMNYEVYDITEMETIISGYVKYYINLNSSDIDTLKSDEPKLKLAANCLFQSTLSHALRNIQLSSFGSTHLEPFDWANLGSQYVERAECLSDYVETPRNKE